MALFRIPACGGGLHCRAEARIVGPEMVSVAAGSASDADASKARPKVVRSSTMGGR